MTNTSFNIYNASAGSGKTFTLVKEYLKICFTSQHQEPYKHILAITFTNKAVAEMKERIISTLKSFANSNILDNPNDMFLILCEELQMNGETLHSKSIHLLHNIVKNYAAFDISTIDKFTQKIIRAFAFDLKIPINFEVELDTTSLLKEAVDNLISKAGSNKTLTQLLIDFALEKTDNDKSWDITYDFNNVSHLLVSENDLPFIKILQSKTIQDFQALKTLLKTKIASTKDDIIKIAKDTLTLIEECGLEHTDFSRGYLPKYFVKLKEENFKVSFDLKWQSDLTEGNTLYPKKIDANIADTIESIQPQLSDYFESSKSQVFQLKFLSDFYKNITPLSVLNAIQKEVEAIKKERDVLLISEFNTLISDEIKDQPTPFIYERIGEKFKHYFIDEFQDTSALQWENLIPLLDNSLSSENSSVTLVGDAKQAIYRWRGGKANQFIDLYSNKHPFFIDVHTKQLPNNYRSCSEIVSFNNAFFDFISETSFNSTTYQSLYKESTQQTKKEQSGYVNLNFLELKKEDNRDESYCKEVLNTVHSCIKNGFDLKDICILVRKRKNGVAIANYLSDAGIDIMSSETLLLNNAPEVNFIIHLLEYIQAPKDNELKIKVLQYLANHKLNINDKHTFYCHYINVEIDSFFPRLSTNYKIDFNYLTALQLPLYECVNYIVNVFELIDDSNAYVQYFLDVVFDYSQKHTSSITHFLEYFDSKKDVLSIVSPPYLDAVQIMTIHKSKGLEFPVVIFPYADLNIYQEKDAKEWFPVDTETYNGFSNAFLNYSKNFKHYGNTGLDIYDKHQSELELDNINLLYVVLTRAIQQLHIISSMQNKIDTHTYSGLFVEYLQHINIWDESKTVYEFGNPTKDTILQPNQSEQKTIKLQHIDSSKISQSIKIVTKSGYLWDTPQQEAIEKGNLIHDIMSNIKTELDVEFVFDTFVHSGIINNQQTEELKGIVNQIINHIRLKHYFDSNNNHIIYNEKDIITKDGMTLRPDRLIITPQKEVIIMDYKTGVLDKKHKQQLQLYKDAIIEMGYKIINTLLIYINDNIDVKEV